MKFALLDKQVKALAEQITKELKNKMTENTSQLHNKHVEKLKNSFVSSMVLLKGNLLVHVWHLDNLERDSDLIMMEGMTASPTHAAIRMPNWAEDVIRRFEEKVKSINNRLNWLSAESNKACIKFKGLGLHGLPRRQYNVILAKLKGSARPHRHFFQKARTYIFQRRI
jgi:hypothetical protein